MVYLPCKSGVTCWILLFSSLLDETLSCGPVPIFSFVGFVALHPKSTAMVMAGRSVHLTTLFSWASLNKQLTSTLCTYFCL